MKPIQIGVLGTIAFGALCWFCITTGAAAIQTDIASRATANLSDDRFTAVHIEIDGRSVTLLGTVPTGTARVEAEKSVRNLPGVSAVINRLGLAASEPSVRRIQTPYRLSVSFSGSNAVVDGLVRSEVTRATLIGVATKKYGVGYVVDRLQVEGNIRPDWDTAAKSIVGAMTLLTEVDAKFTDLEVAVTGQVATQREWERAVAAIRSAVPYGVALKLNVTINGE